MAAWPIREDGERLADPLYTSLVEYQVVDDSYRGQDDSDLLADLLSGKTVFVPDVDNNWVTSLYIKLTSKYRRKLHRRASDIEGQSGFVLWLDDGEPR